MDTREGQLDFFFWPEQYDNIIHKYKCVFKINKKDHSNSYIGLKDYIKSGAFILRAANPIFNRKMRLEF